jgi:hypothetical protein
MSFLVAWENVRGIPEVGIGRQCTHNLSQGHDFFCVVRTISVTYFWS